MSSIMTTLERAVAGFSQDAEWVGLRRVREKTSFRGIRNEKPERNTSSIDEGVMIEVLVDGHFGYAATADTSEKGLRRAFDTALVTTKAAASRKVFSFTAADRPVAKGNYRSPRQAPLDQASLEQLTSNLLAASEAMKISDQIVNRSSGVMIIETEMDMWSSTGTDVHQNFDMVVLDIGSTASVGAESQTRTLNGWSAQARQWGAEAWDRKLLIEEAQRVARESVELLTAENCPSGKMDLLLMPDQMMLQIHESIGHPLEIDRILGDERNFAGWSFVKPEDFGKLQYGSKLMNVTFDPTRPGELASYAFDEGGIPARREFLIKDGLLVRGLGSQESQRRSGLPGVANFRSASWNRAPIDRMANINVEPGENSLDEMIASIERGVLMHSNRSWSIDDYRNKFQFSCEYAKLIENGRVVRTVRNPNYRGITVDFWNRLSMVGKADSVETFGTPYCGKGEPSQIIRVGHATPPCLFRGIEVFGGAS